MNDTRKWLTSDEMVLGYISGMQTAIVYIQRIAGTI
jgi:hypothetical protein